MIIKDGNVWMMEGKGCQSVAREIAEKVMITLKCDPNDFRMRDEIIMGISPTLNSILDSMVEQ